MNAVEKAVEIIGTRAKLARACSQPPQAVTRWLRSGRVPARRALAIEAATGGKVTCQDLRPDVEWLIDDSGTVTGYHVRVDAPNRAEAA